MIANDYHRFYILNQAFCLEVSRTATALCALCIAGVQSLYGCENIYTVTAAQETVWCALHRQYTRCKLNEQTEQLAETTLRTQYRKLMGLFA